MFLITVCIYLAIGIAVEYTEELIAAAHVKEIFKGREEILGFDPNGIFNPITERVKAYNIDWFLTDLSDLLLWPFGIVWWLRGMNKMHHMSESELDELFEVNCGKDS